MPAPSAARCWCGSDALTPYAPEYALCSSCRSLVLERPPSDPARVVDEQRSLYGLSYFTAHARGLGHPELEERARLDLAERCTFWVRTLLRHRPPPARVLEIGSASGAFVALLTESGYDATGLDLSPAVTAFARETFQVNVLTGPLEDQRLDPADLGVVAMMDVLEHLPDPIGTLRRCATALAPDGLLFVQTPRFDPARAWEELRESADPFLLQLKAGEHLFLLSEEAARRLLHAAGFAHVRFVPAIFSQYDMSFLASRAPIPDAPEATWRGALRRTRQGRIVEALLDQQERSRAELSALQAHVQVIERDRAARLDALHRQGERLHGLEERVQDLELREQGLQRQIASLSPRAAELESILRKLGPVARLLRDRRS